MIAVAIFESYLINSILYYRGISIKKYIPIISFGIYLLNLSYYIFSSDMYNMLYLEIDNILDKQSLKLITSQISYMDTLIKSIIPQLSYMDTLIKSIIPQFSYMDTLIKSIIPQLSYMDTLIKSIIPQLSYMDTIIKLIIPQILPMNISSYRDVIVYLFPIVCIISIIDIKYRIVFDIDVICGIIIEIVLLLIIGNIDVAITSFLGGSLLFCISYLIAKISDEMGTGDSTYYFLAGSIVGIDYALYLFFISFFVAFLYIVGLRITKNKLEDGMISFTPFISISTIITVLIAISNQ